MESCLSYHGLSERFRYHKEALLCDVSGISNAFFLEFSVN